MTDRLAVTTAALAEEIIARDLPHLGPTDRDAAVRLVTGAISHLPDSLRPGVSLAGWAVRTRRLWVRSRWADVDLPVMREYVRLVRGLAVAAACEVSEERGRVRS